MKAAALNKIVTADAPTPSGQKTAYFYDGSALRWIQDTNTYYCLRAQGYPVSPVLTQAQANALGTGKPWEANSCRNKIITVDATKPYRLDPTENVVLLRWLDASLIPDAETFLCLAEYTLAYILPVATQQDADFLGSGKPWVSPCFAVGAVRNHIVSDTKTSTSYYITNDDLWHWIPDAKTYNCLRSRNLSVIESNTTQINSLLPTHEGATMTNWCAPPSSIAALAQGPKDCTQPPAIPNFYVSIVRRPDPEQRDHLRYPSFGVVFKWDYNLYGGRGILNFFDGGTTFGDNLTPETGTTWRGIEYSLRRRRCL